MVVELSVEVLASFLEFLGWLGGVLQQPFVEVVDLAYIIGVGLKVSLSIVFIVYLWSCSQLPCDEIHCSGKYHYNFKLFFG